VGLTYFSNNPKDVPWGESEDNPLSAAFKSPKQREADGKPNAAARWWAFIDQRRRDRATAQCSHEKLVDGKP